MARPREYFRRLKNSHLRAGRYLPGSLHRCLRLSHGGSAKVSSKAVKEFLSSDTSIQEVRLVFFSRGDSETFLKNHALT